MKNSRTTNTTLNNRIKVGDAIVITPNRLNHGERTFRSKGFWFAVALTLVSVGTLIKLGLWQLDRGNEKLRYEQQLSQRAVQPSKPLDTVLNEWGEAHVGTQQPVPPSTLNGLKADVELVEPSGLILLLDNQVNQGIVGYVIYMLGEVQTQDVRKQLLIDLGFVAASNDRRELPEIEKITLPIEVSGRLYTRSVNPLSQQLGLENTTPKRIQNINIEALSQYMGQEVLPFIFQPQSLDSWPYEMLWRPTAMKSEKHFGYSFQWFVMAAVLLSLMLLIGFRYLKKYSHMNKK
ncbi:SURF1 family protein [Vibrio sp. Isolate31]|uniref:SURF1 family protein n=1 Tax=unclassified Vibrio TaxID=2614977 RepID=UPI001EFDA90C|nr:MULTISPECIES: SURF1 family protein [unclassified Vibrio]MCG9555541.1 SURF1 family protein [Vibrio sp. Isolate32]MCG9602709.1 SURF1 family protein [Vibrio sp. Isolate31]